MAGTGTADLYSQYQELLQASIESLDMIPSFSPGLGGAPERAFVIIGTPVLDCCDQLTVSPTPIREAPTQPLEMGAGTRHQQQFRKNYIGFQVTITRCLDWDNESLPSIEAQEAVSEQVAADGWALWNYLWNLARSGEIFTLCGGVYFDSLAPLTPSGGCYGWVLTIRAELEGFEGTPT